MAAKSLPLDKQRLIHRLLAEGRSHRWIGRRVGVHSATVGDYAKRVPPPDAKVRECRTAAGLPESLAEPYEPFVVGKPGPWLVLSDLHVPYHDRAAVEAAVAEGRRRRCVGVLLNGDVLDSHEISRHSKEGNKARYVEEIEYGRRTLAYVRSRFPKADIVYKAGNHEERLDRYILDRAPALFGLEGVNLPALLHLADHGIGWVADKRVIQLGKLSVIHGHEYRGGVSTAVNAARGLYLKSGGLTLCGHWHRTSMHRDSDIRRRPKAAWATGCLCSLTPAYHPINQWNLGWAVVDVAADGSFRVDNRDFSDGHVY